MHISQRRKWGTADLRCFVQVSQLVSSSRPRTLLSTPPTLLYSWKDPGPWFPRGTTQRWHT